MRTSLIYRSSRLYALVMRVLYGRHYSARYRALDALVEEGSSVVELCCGPPVLFRDYLRRKRVRYTGLDMNPGFIGEVKQTGADGRVVDLRAEQPLPRADYVLMQASLYHFLPDPKPIVDRMLAAATRGVIIAEPIRNLSDSRMKLIALLGRVLTNPGSGSQPHRFTEKSLDSLFAGYGDRVRSSFLIPGGREKVYVLTPTRAASPERQAF